MTVTEASGGVARRSGDRGGGSGERRPLRYLRSSTVDAEIELRGRSVARVN
ncbi:MAG: hypothetical protein HC833_07940 [Leptolyngbyaceae cyanobacterium RM1_406_9]|nr:hypothetical protein [Leptolyngbyaceae cyanobacterium RM1_406_9]